MSHSKTVCTQQSQLLLSQIEEPRATVKIFSSGKLVIQAPALSNVHSAIRQLYPRLYPARKKRTDGKARGRVKDDGDKFWRNKK